MLKIKFCVQQKYVTLYHHIKPPLEKNNQNSFNKYFTIGNTSWNLVPTMSNRVRHLYLYKLSISPKNSFNPSSLY